MGGLATISLGIVLATPQRSMTRPAFENEGIRAIPAVLVLSMQAEEFPRSPSISHLHPPQRHGALGRAVL